jgi:hypothetical protein
MPSKVPPSYPLGNETEKAVSCFPNRRFTGASTYALLQVARLTLLLNGVSPYVNDKSTMPTLCGVLGF